MIFLPTICWFSGQRLFVPTRRLAAGTVPETTEILPLVGGRVMVMLAGRALQFWSRAHALPICDSTPDATTEPTGGEPVGGNAATGVSFGSTGGVEWGAMTCCDADPAGAPAK